VFWMNIQYIIVIIHLNSSNTFEKSLRASPTPPTLALAPSYHQGLAWQGSAPTSTLAPRAEPVKLGEAEEDAEFRLASVSLRPASDSLRFQMPAGCGWGQ